MSLSRPNLPLLMLAAREAVTAYFRPVFRQFDLTEQQWRVLRVIYDNGPLQIGQISEYSQLLGPSLTGILNRMIELDLVSKQSDPADSRAVFILMSKTGRRKIEVMIPHIEVQYRRLAADLGEDELTELYDVLRRVVAKTQGAIPDKVVNVPRSVTKSRSKAKSSTEVGDRVMDSSPPRGSRVSRKTSSRG
jgi:homoprotocatechuate degradation regulator HpaR